MLKKNNHLPLIPLFQKFITETQSGKRVQKNGKSIRNSTVENYKALLSNLLKYSEKFNDAIEINVKFRHTKQVFEKEQKFYRKFYKQFTDFLYARNCTDNYVGLLIKTLRSFFKYLQEVKGYETGNFYKSFYSCREEIAVLVFSQEQLSVLIFDEAFNSSLPKHLIKTRDVLVFGCTVGLRFCDLIALKQRNLEHKFEKTYLIAKSQKTNMETRIKLPQYAIQILAKYKKKQTTLLPSITIIQFNNNIKQIAILAGWTYEVGKERSRRGVRREIKKNGKPYRFCDMVSSHIMRRTAITTLLLMGVPEPLVRKISGHSANSKEFYKYVNYTDSFIDDETDRAFAKLTIGINTINQ